MGSKSSEQGLSRRRFLTAGAGAAAGLALASAPPAGGQTEVTEGVPRMEGLPPGTQLVDPPGTRSRQGELSRRLDVLLTDVYLPAADGSVSRLRVRTYNGRLPGPTLRVRPGEELDLCLNNFLPPNPDPAWPADVNCPHHSNSTNLHLHGLRLSPRGDGNNPFVSVPPGGYQGHRLRVPEDQSPGTYWYHAGLHGSAAVQVANGLAGALIVEGDFDAVPEIAPAREQVLVLQEIRRESPEWPGRLLEDPDRPAPVLVNGQQRPVVRMRPGEVQRWRLLNATGDSSLNLALHGHQLHLVAVDGRQLAAVEPVDGQHLAPGARADVMVRASFERGRYALSARTGREAEPRVLALLEVMGDPRPMELPVELPEPPASLAPLPQAPRSRTVTFGLSETPEGRLLPTLDGELYDPQRIGHEARLGEVQEWLLRNPTNRDLSFHLQGHGFQVVEVGGEGLAAPRWRDVVTVPGSSHDVTTGGSPGEVVIRLRFGPHAGDFLLGTSDLSLRDRGMLQRLRVVDPEAGEAAPPPPCPGPAAGGCGG